MCGFILQSKGAPLVFKCFLWYVIRALCLAFLCDQGVAMSLLAILASHISGFVIENECHRLNMSDDFSGIAWCYGGNDLSHKPSISLHVQMQQV